MMMMAKDKRSLAAQFVDVFVLLSCDMQHFMSTACLLFCSTLSLSQFLNQAQSMNSTL